MFGGIGDIMAGSNTIWLSELVSLDITQMNNSLPNPKRHFALEFLQNPIRGLPRTGFWLFNLRMNGLASEPQQLRRLKDLLRLAFHLLSWSVILTSRIILCYNVHSVCIS